MFKNFKKWNRPTVHFWHDINLCTFSVLQTALCDTFMWTHGSFRQSANAGFIVFVAIYLIDSAMEWEWNYTCPRPRCRWVRARGCKQIATTIGDAYFRINKCHQHKSQNRKMLISKRVRYPAISIKPPCAQRIFINLILYHFLMEQKRMIIMFGY